MVPLHSFVVFFNPIRIVDFQILIIDLSSILIEELLLVLGGDFLPVFGDEFVDF